MKLVPRLVRLPWRVLLLVVDPVPEGRSVVDVAGDGIRQGVRYLSVGGVDGTDMVLDLSLVMFLKTRFLRHPCTILCTMNDSEMSSSIALAIRIPFCVCASVTKLCFLTRLSASFLCMAFLRYLLLAAFNVLVSYSDTLAMRGRVSSSLNLSVAYLVTICRALQFEVTVHEYEVVIK